MFYILNLSTDSVSIAGSRWPPKYLAKNSSVAVSRQVRLPVSGSALNERCQIGDPACSHAAGEHVRRERQSNKHFVSAIAAAHDGDAFGIGYAFPDRPVHAICQIVVHLSGEL